MDKRRNATVYLPNGATLLFTTDKEQAKSSPYVHCEKIEGEPDRLNIGLKMGETIVAKSYVMIPYILELS